MQHITTHESDDFDRLKKKNNAKWGVLFVEYFPSLFEQMGTMKILLNWLYYYVIDSIIIII